MAAATKKIQEKPADEPAAGSASDLEEERATTREEFDMTNIPAFPVDAISALGIHNGVVRIQFMRLNVDGKAVPNVEIHVPISQLKVLSETLAKTAR